MYIANFSFGKYFSGHQGADVCVSSWNRLAPNTMPSLAKAGANYLNSQLIRMEAEINGYTEGIALDTNGYLSEGAGENLFLVHKGTLFTSPFANSILDGITRSSVFTIARDLGITVVEKTLPRDFSIFATKLSSPVLLWRSPTFALLTGSWLATVQWGL